MKDSSSHIYIVHTGSIQPHGHIRERPHPIQAVEGRVGDERQSVSLVKW